MDYNEFKENFKKILNKHILEESKKNLLKKISEHPERYTGIFRPTKPLAKILQNILQSQEIQMGNALEEIITKIFSDKGYSTNHNIIINNLKVDLLVEKDGKHYMIEMKIRDDHDSSKREGQIENFKHKIKSIQNLKKAYFYFIDPSLKKNEKWYKEKIEQIKQETKNNIEIKLLYGEELFKEFFGKKEGQKIWENIQEALKEWKEELPDLPEVNFDKEPEKSFEEIKDIEEEIWKKLIENDKLWEEGIIRTIFPKNSTFNLLIKYWENSKKELAEKLKGKIEKYQPKDPPSNATKI